MTGVSEHDGEQEGERDGGVETWVHLAVAGHPVSVDQHLEAVRELVRPEESRRLDVGLEQVQNRWETTVTVFLLFNTIQNKSIIPIKCLNVAQLHCHV